eukprot:scaffold11130_cov136-Isochrysis_galbana.AAC.2
MADAHPGRRPEARRPGSGGRPCFASGGQFGEVFWARVLLFLSINPHPRCAKRQGTRSSILGLVEGDTHTPRVARGVVGRWPRSALRAPARVCPPIHQARSAVRISRNRKANKAQSPKNVHAAGIIFAFADRCLPYELELEPSRPGAAGSGSRPHTAHRAQSTDTWQALGTEGRGRGRGDRGQGTLVQHTTLLQPSSIKKKTDTDTLTLTGH